MALAVRWDVPHSAVATLPEDQLLPRLAALAIPQASDGRALCGRKQESARVTTPAQAADLIDHLRATGVTIIYDPATRAIRTDTKRAVAVSVS